MGRLISEVLDSSNDSLDYVDAFAFDLNGNRLKQTRDWGSTSKVDYATTYTFDNNDRLITESQDNATGDDSATTYGYTGTQQTSKSVNVNGALKTTQSFAYDLQGRMTKVCLETMNTAGTAVASVEETSFEYDTGGTRIASVHKIDSTNDGTFETIRRTEYLTDHANPTGYSQVIMETETDANGNPIRRTAYTIGHDQISQTVYGPGPGGATWDSGTTHYFGTDGHGSVRVLYDSLAAVVTSAADVLQVFHYDAYGNLLNLAATSALTSYLYSGEAFDTRINQQYLRARWYDPQTGRFTSLDPFVGNLSDPQSLHKYLYTHADPVNGADPSGLLVSLMGGTFISSLHRTGYDSTVASRGISIVFTLLILNSLSDLIGNLAYEHVLVETARRLDVKYKRDVRDEIDKTRDPNKKYFVHGTTTAAWQGKANDIKIFDDGRKLDFGYGFYTRAFDLQGFSDASRFAINRSNYMSSSVFGPVSDKTGGLPFVILYEMNISDWKSLSRKDYGVPFNPTPDYERDVNNYRSDTGPLYAGKDVVFGPTARLSGRKWVADSTMSNQYKFEAGGIAKLRAKYILPAIDFYGPWLA
ncbi:MAG: RHS repeat-associated core domain-containing protein [Pirellulaceae bacterium]